jgi:hypothetical protein
VYNERNTLTEILDDVLSFQMEGIELEVSRNSRVIQGKKIVFWRDGMAVLIAIIRYRLSD